MQGTAVGKFDNFLTLPFPKLRDFGQHVQGSRVAVFSVLL